MGLKYYKNRVTRKLSEHHVKRYLDKLEGSGDIVLFIFRTQTGHWKLGLSDRVDYLNAQRQTGIEDAELVLDRRILTKLEKSTGSRSIRTVTDYVYKVSNEKLEVFGMTAVSIY